MGEVIRFPVQEAEVEGVRCKTCGFVIVRTRDEIQTGKEDREECFCCQRNIKLPLANPKPCPDCEGTGVIATFARVDHEESGPRVEDCLGCLGRGTR